jgi:hypothetical protein
MPTTKKMKMSTISIYRYGYEYIYIYGDWSGKVILVNITDCTQLNA